MANNAVQNNRKETHISANRIDELERQYYYSDQICEDVRSKLLDEEQIIIKEKDTLKNRNQLQRKQQAERNISMENVVCLGEHLKLLKENLFQISCKIDELQELKKRKEAEQCRNATFVCCCFIIYMFCLVVLLFGGSWLYYFFQTLS